MSTAVVGIDVGGTKIAAGVVDSTGHVVSGRRFETPARSAAVGVVEGTIAEAVAQFRVAHEVVAVGIGAAGFVDTGGSVRFAPHLPLRDAPLQATLTARLGLPVVVDNDANTAARAEMRFGAGRGYRQALCLTLGTGIGGAVVLEGQVIRGLNGYAGEFGHVQVEADGRPCECGQSGCWEQYASGRALHRAAVRAGVDVEDGAAVTTAARSGEAWALQAFAQVAEWFGVGLAGLVSIFDPEVVIVGGGLAESGDLLLARAFERMERRLPGRGHRRVPPLVAAELGPLAGMIGAADLAREHIASA